MRAAAALLAALAVAGCAAHRSSIVFLDGENHSPPGAVAVIDPATGADRAVIDRADTLATVSATRVRQRAIPERQAEDRDGALIKELPDPARTFRFFYSTDDAEFDASSAATLAAALAEIARRPGVDIAIVGHTDRAGDPAYNEALATRRAGRLRQELAGAGIDMAAVRLSSRGERDALAANGDHDQADRYVEVVVR